MDSTVHEQHQQQESKLNLKDSTKKLCKKLKFSFSSLQNSIHFCIPFNPKYGMTKLMDTTKRKVQHLTLIVLTSEYNMLI